MVKDVEIESGDDVRITNDPDEIAEQQAEGRFDDPDHRPDDEDERLQSGHGEQTDDVDQKGEGGPQDISETEIGDETAESDGSN